MLNNIQSSSSYHHTKKWAKPISLISARTIVLFGVGSLLSWIYVLFIAPWPYASPDIIEKRERNPAHQNENELPPHNYLRNESHETEVGSHQVHSSVNEVDQGRKPRVVGVYAYQFNNGPRLESDREYSDDVKAVPNAINIQYSSKNTFEIQSMQRSNYIYLTEQIDPYLLDHASQPLRRMRVHHDSAFYFDHTESQANYEAAITNSNAKVYTKDPLSQLMFSSRERIRHKRIVENSKGYADEKADPLIDDKCDVPPRNAKWMMASYPSCNLVHEYDLPRNLGIGNSKLLGHGYWRDVWKILDSAPSPSFSDKHVYEWKNIAMKTIRYEHEFTEYNHDRHRRDALASDRLSSSPNVVSIFAYCGHSGYFEFATGGSLSNRIQEHLMAIMDVESSEKLGKERDSNDAKPLSIHEKLDFAHQIARALADAHDADGLRGGDGKITSAAIVHSDITPEQYILIDGRYKLNDFNRCRFMRRYRNSTDDTANGVDGKPCGFTVGHNPGVYRSPEEYSYKEETEKIDIYSLGNIFYTLLTDLEPWEDIEDEKDAQRAIKKGKRPTVPKEKMESEGFAEAALRNAMLRCWKADPEERPRAREVANYFSKKLRAYNATEK